jgi:hypothetical protein
MARNTLLTVGVVLSLPLASVSLAFQITKGKASKFGRYRYPANITELDRRVMLGDMGILRGRIPMTDGIGVGEIGHKQNNDPIGASYRNQIYDYHRDRQPKP